MANDFAPLKWQSTRQFTRQQKNAALRRLLAETPFVVAPAVHDMFSLRLAEQAGFESACISGAMLSYSLLGVPDIGLLTLTECVEHCRRLTRHARIPITADGDAGYGNPRGVHHTVELFEDAGAAGLNIEDQVVPRRWGSTRRKEVVPVGEMVAKLAAAVRARVDDNFMIIARTDAFGVEPIEQIIARARAYQDAGADMLLPIGPVGAACEAEVEALVRALQIPVTLSAGTGLQPAASAGNITLERMREIGVRRASLTTLLPLAAMHGMGQALGTLQGALQPAPASTVESPAATQTIDALFDTTGQIAFEEALLEFGR